MALWTTAAAREDRSSYIERWLKVPKNDRRAIFEAAAQAQRVVDCLNGLQKDKAEAA